MQPDQLPNYQPPQPPQPNIDNGYEFILDPPKKKMNLMNFNSRSPRTKILVAVIGALVLIILFVIIKGLFTTSPYNTTDFLSVIEQQGEILHILGADLTNSSGQQPVLNINNQNFVATSQLVIASDQSLTVKYLKTNGYKVNPKDLTAILTTSPDTQLANAQQSNNFNQVFVSVMQQQLNQYEQTLSTAYNSTTGVKGKALLKSNYANAEKLIKQLNLPAS